MNMNTCRETLWKHGSQSLFQTKMPLDAPLWATLLSNTDSPFTSAASSQLCRLKKRQEEQAVFTLQLVSHKSKVRGKIARVFVRDAPVRPTRIHKVFIPVNRHRNNEAPS